MSAINNTEADDKKHILERTCPICFRKLRDIPPTEGIDPKDHLAYEAREYDKPISRAWLDKYYGLDDT